MPANVTGLFTTGANALQNRFDLSKVFKTIEEVKKTPLIAYETLFELKSKLQQQLANLTQYPPTGLDNIEYQQFRTNLQAAIDEIDFNAKFNTSVNQASVPIIHYTPVANLPGEPVQGVYKAFIRITEGIKPAIGSIDEVDGVANTLITRSEDWLASTDNHTLAGQLQDISYTDASGVRRRGVLEVHYNTSSGSITFRAANIFDDVLLNANPSLVELFNIFQRRDWLWSSNEIRPEVTAFFNSLNVGSSINYFEFFRQIAKFDQGEDGLNVLLRLFDDIAENSDFAAGLLGDSGLVRAWEALSSFPTLSRRVDLLEILEKVAPRFKYLAGSTPVEGFAGLKAVLTDHVSAQNFILNLNKADELFGGVTDLTYSGIKTSQEVRLIGEGNILGKIVGQNLEPGALVDARVAVRNSGFSSDTEWLTIISKLQSEEILFTPTTTGVSMSRNGYEFGEISGTEMRILHAGDYGSVILYKNKTVTVAGRLGYEPAVVNEAFGTHYFRWLRVAKVGKNIGGIDVLAIDNWSWAKNHAWIKAAIDNTMEGIGEVRFITPFDRANIFVNGFDASGSLTITGNEFAVMLKHGYGVDVDGIMKPLSEITPQDWWDDVLDYAIDY